MKYEVHGLGLRAWRRSTIYEREENSPASDAKSRAKATPDLSSNVDSRYRDRNLNTDRPTL